MKTSAKIIFALVAFGAAACGKVDSQSLALESLEQNLMTLSFEKSADEVAFDTDVLPLLDDSCTTCHDNPAPDYATALELVTTGKPEDSDLYLRATGQVAKHKVVWKTDSDDAKVLANWISALK